MKRLSFGSMVTPDLPPTELMVLDIFQRLDGAKLGPPTIPTITQLSKIQSRAVTLAIHGLVNKGYLQGGGSGTRGYELTKKAGEVEVANRPAQKKTPVERSPESTAAA